MEDCFSSTSRRKAESRYSSLIPADLFSEIKMMVGGVFPKENRRKERIFSTPRLGEFEEETGLTPQGPFFDLGNILQKNKKRVYAWAFEGVWPKGKLPECNEITLEFPKGSGKSWTFPEIDRVLMLPRLKPVRSLGTSRCPSSIVS